MYISNQRLFHKSKHLICYLEYTRIVALGVSIRPCIIYVCIRGKDCSGENNDFGVKTLFELMSDELL